MSSRAKCFFLNSRVCGWTHWARVTPCTLSSLYSPTPQAAWHNFCTQTLYCCYIDRSAWNSFMYLSLQGLFWHQICFIGLFCTNKNTAKRSSACVYIWSDSVLQMNGTSHLKNKAESNHPGQWAGLVRAFVVLPGRLLVR